MKYNESGNRKYGEKSYIESPHVRFNSNVSFTRKKNTFLQSNASNYHSTSKKWERIVAKSVLEVMNPAKMPTSKSKISFLNQDKNNWESDSEQSMLSY